MTALRFQTGGDIKHPQPPFRAVLGKEKRMQRQTKQNPLKWNKNMVNPHTLRGRRSCSISFLHKRVAVTFTAPSWVYIHSGTYRTNIKSHTKLIGHLSSSQQNETEIFHQWNHSKHTDGLSCCMSVHSHLSVVTHLTIGLIKDNWRTNQLINQQTTNLQNLLENGLLWVSDSLTVKTSIFCTFTLQAVQTSNNQQTCKTSIKKKKKFSVTDWISG